MEKIDTSLYTIARKEDGTLVRIDGLGGETPEPGAEYHRSQITFHEQVIANFIAQAEKVEEFEIENPSPEVPEQP